MHVAPVNNQSLAACTDEIIELQSTPGIFAKKKKRQKKKTKAGGDVVAQENVKRSLAAQMPGGPA